MKTTRTRKIFIEVEIIRVIKKRPVQPKTPKTKQSVIFETGAHSTRSGKLSEWFFDKFLRRI